MAYDRVSINGRRSGNREESFSLENEQDDAERGGRTRLASPNSQAQTRTGKYSFPLPADHEQN